MAKVAHLPGYQQAKEQYWRDRAEREQVFRQKLGREMLTSDHHAFAKSEKLHIAEMGASLTGPRGGQYHLSATGEKVYDSGHAAAHQVKGEGPWKK